jgi:hypothetical protein
VSRGRDARALQRALAGQTGVAVEVRWDRSVASEHVPGRWAWHVSWADGPTVARMRAAAEPAAGPAGIEAGRLVYQRIVQPRSYALAMIRHLRAGRPLAELGGTARLDDQLWGQDYPDRGTAAEVELADRLVRLAGGLEHRAHAILAEHGLAAVDGPDATVIPLPRQPSHRGRPPAAAPRRPCTVVQLDQHAHRPAHAARRPAGR